MTGINTVNANVLITTGLYSSSVRLSRDVWVVLVRFCFYSNRQIKTMDVDPNKDIVCSINNKTPTTLKRRDVNV